MPAHVRKASQDRALVRQPSQEQLRRDICRNDTVIREKAAHEQVELGVVAAVLAEELRLLELSGPEFCQDGLRLQDDMHQQVNALQLLNEAAAKQLLHCCSHRCGHACGRSAVKTGNCRTAQATLVRRYIRPSLQQLASQVEHRQYSLLNEEHCEVRNLQVQAQAELKRACEMQQISEDAVEAARRECAVRLQDAGNEVMGLRKQLALEGRSCKRQFHEMREQTGRVRLRARKDRSNLRMADDTVTVLQHFNAWSQCVLRCSRLQLQRRVRSITDTLRRRSNLTAATARLAPLCATLLAGCRHCVAVKQQERDNAS